MTSIAVWLAANSVMFTLVSLASSQFALRQFRLESAIFFYRTAGLEHFEHAVGDEKSSDHVAGGGDDGDDSQDGREGALLFADQDDRADYGDGIESVGQRHQRSVEQRRDVADDFESDECRQHEDEQRVDQIGTHMLPQFSVLGSAFSLSS